MLDFMDGNCNADGYMDFDLMYLSELDWLNDELAFLLSLKLLPLPIHWLFRLVPLTLFINAINPSTSCFGQLSWGHLYPLSGHLSLWLISRKHQPFSGACNRDSTQAWSCKANNGERCAMSTCYRTHAAEIPIQDEYVLPCTGN